MTARASVVREYSWLPRAIPCQHCAPAAIMRKRQLEGTWSMVWAGSERILAVKSCSKVEDLHQRASSR